MSPKSGPTSPPMLKARVPYRFRHRSLREKCRPRCTPHVGTDIGFGTTNVGHRPSTPFSWPKSANIGIGACKYFPQPQWLWSPGSRLLSLNATHPPPADICRHGPTWADMDRHRPTLADIGSTGPHGPTSADISRHRPTLADIGRHRPSIAPL